MKTRVLALLLALMLLLCGCSLFEEPLPEVSAEDWREAFQLGNDAYDDEDWRLAEAYYLLAESLCEEDDDVLWDTKNNRGLALLQQGKSKEALALYEDILDQELWSDGYWINYLIAGHAAGKRAEDLLSSRNGEYVLEKLVDNLESSPGDFQNILYGIYYNMIYMDMEQGKPIENEDRYQPLEDYSDKNISLSRFNFSNSEGLCNFFTEILKKLDEMNYQTYGEHDPELEELIDYLNAKYGQEAF